MAEYWVIIKKGQSVSSDQAVNLKPTTGSKVLEPAENATVVKMEGASYADACRAAFLAYPGRANNYPLAAEVANVKES